jgi:RNA polymerase sigma-70 factor (ECF subfamily)
MAGQVTTSGYRRLRTGAWGAAETRAEATTEDGTDEVLMLRVGQGDRPAFQLLVQRHLPRSMALARRITTSASDAEEIAQEAFLRVWTSAPRWRAEGAAFRTWLYRIVVNLCLDRGRRKPFMPLEEAGDPLDPAPDALTVLEQQETARRVAEAVEALPDRQRAALVLSYYEGMSNADAAAVLGVSVSGLEALLVRARRALRGRLDESAGSGAGA